MHLHQRATRPDGLSTRRGNVITLYRQRPYHAESTGSHLNTEVKQRWAKLVLGWETAWEHWVPLTF